jgi:Cu(I)/Ag(I) efflux system membrane protein CusA/SilA
VLFVLVGGFYPIFALGYNFSVAVWIGFVALYGLVVETEVVMVVYLHEVLDRRMRTAEPEGDAPLTMQSVREATIEGPVLRLRPKIMTVGTSLMGLLPIMWSTGAGSDVMQPLAAPMIGGLITSTIHVLVVRPVLFFMMKQGTLKKSRIARWMI